jgi:hypothetical protein
VGDWLTHSTRPIIHAIAPKAAAELALRIAEHSWWLTAPGRVSEYGVSYADGRAEAAVGPLLAA